MYFVIHASEDGDHSVHHFENAEELLEKLNGDWWGLDPEFMTFNTNDHINLDSSEGLLIIKGWVTIPTPVKVETRWTVD